MRRFVFFLFLFSMIAAAAPRKVHVVGLGAARAESYSRVGDPAGARTGEKILKVRPLVVDGVVKDWTTGEAHELTDRSFVVRRALRLNDTLPGERRERWVWQRGPWLLINRANGHAQPLKLPDYDPVVSQLSWFRDYAAYCGVTASGKNLYAVVMQVGARKPALAKKMGNYDAEHHPDPVCAPVTWQREPFRALFQPTGGASASFDIVPGSAVLVEESGDEEDEKAGK